MPLSMRCKHLGIHVLLGIAVWTTVPGCLSLGGTTYSDSPQTSERISALENRVGVLEQAVNGKPSVTAKASSTTQSLR